MQQLSDNLFCFHDTCNVYVLRRGTKAVLIDFGAGDVLDALPQIGVEQVTDVLMTHHHRDQAQGLHRAVEVAACIWVPGAEQELFTAVEDHWQTRPLRNNYNVREDRFTITESVPVTGTLPEYRTTWYGGQPFTVVPLPGHTVGSVGFITHVDGRRVAFTGDLLAGPGKLWSLAATQWSYAGAEGLAATTLSLLDLQDRRPDVLLPSHGDVMTDVNGAINLLVERLKRLLAVRGEHLDVIERRNRPYVQVLPHLLCNRTAHAMSYVILSNSGKALIVDYGYDQYYGIAAGTDRASRRPWMYTIPVLRKSFDVTRIDVVIPTHYHDDHVAGFNLLREVEGAQVWATEDIADILGNPWFYDLPCLWFEPVDVDRVLPLNEPFRWEEHELTLHPLPGHTLHAVAIEATIDGAKVLFTGDQHTEQERPNYVYKNRFRIEDYRTAGELYLRLRPDLLLTGHWGAVKTDDGLLERLHDRGAALADLHRALLPLDSVDFDAEGFGAWIRPYQAAVPEGERLRLEVEVRNPLPYPEQVTATVVAPPDWYIESVESSTRLGPGKHARLPFTVVPPPGTAGRRFVVAADLQVGTRRFGQHAEALITVT
jgi:glyoxylase-like metal-dependent hydrolase (beta-lactamase superfamily II)